MHFYQIKELFSEYAVQCKCNVIAWRAVPGNPECIGKTARHCQPTVLQVFLGSEFQDERQFQKQIYLLRKSSSKGICALGFRFYICSLSSQTIVYKGCFTSEQLFDFYDDLRDVDYHTHVAVVHSRYAQCSNPLFGNKFSISSVFDENVTQRGTDGRTDRPTDGQT